MPQYEFQTRGSRHTHWVTMPRSEYDAILKNGGIMRRRSQLTGKVVVSVAVDGATQFTSAISHPSTRRLESDALGCHPSQVSEMNARAKRAGLTGIYYRPDGVCVMNSRGQRKKWAEQNGMFDKNGGYGDPQPR